MLQEYVNSYIDAVASGDLKKMHKIENDLQKLGMDKATLLCIVEELAKERKKSGNKSGDRIGR